MNYCDSHIHCAMYDSWEPFNNGPVCSVSHSIEEWHMLTRLQEKYQCICTSFGIHPQNPDAELIPFLESLLKSHAINAVGEAGFDLFSDEYINHIKEQEEVWFLQLELAASYQKPLIVHCRKALDRIFGSVQKLKGIPSVVFHSWAYSPQEAFSLRKKGVNAYFSFGKPLLNNHKNAQMSAASLPLEWILLETDGPYQSLKGEPFTKPSDIVKVYDKLCSLRGIKIEELSQICTNFIRVFSPSVVLP